jgi:hypothetical protein
MEEAERERMGKSEWEQKNTIISNSMMMEEKQQPSRVTSGSWLVEIEIFFIKELFLTKWESNFTLTTTQPTNSPSFNGNISSMSSE